MVLINKQSSVYSENEAPNFCTFDASYDWTVSAGSGTGSHETTYKFAGDRSLKVSNTDVLNTDLTIASGSQTAFIPNKDGSYIYSMYLRNNTVGATQQITSGSINVFEDATLISTMAFSIGKDANEYDVWLRFSQVLSLTAGTTLTFTVTISDDAGSSLATKTLYIDGFMVNYDDRNLGYPARYVETEEVVVGSGALIGFADYNDVTTAATPISFTSSDVVLTNDGLGAFTNKTYLPSGVTDVFDVGTNSFDWTQLKLGDTIEIRLDITTTTTSANQVIDVYIQMAQSANVYDLNIINDKVYKSAGTYNNVVWYGVYMGDVNTLDNPSQLFFKSDANATVTVNGWYCKITTK